MYTRYCILNYANGLDSHEYMYTIALNQGRCIKKIYLNFLTARSWEEDGEKRSGYKY